MQMVFFRKPRRKWRQQWSLAPAPSRLSHWWTLQAMVWVSATHLFALFPLKRQHFLPLFVFACESYQILTFGLFKSSLPKNVLRWGCLRLCKFTFVCSVCVQSFDLSYFISGIDSLSWCYLFLSLLVNFLVIYLLIHAFNSWICHLTPTPILLSFYSSMFFFVVTY